MLSFQLFRFRVTVQPSFWIVSALLGYGLLMGPGGHIMLLLAWIAISFLSILWHELGHAFAFRRYGIQAEIVLYSFGGLAIPVTRRSLTRPQDIVVSAAGPAFQLLIGVPLYFYMKYGDLNWTVDERPFAWYILWMLTWINVVWALVNLLPIWPLDGGHICQSIMGQRREKNALWISIVFAVGMAVFCVKQEMGFNAVFFGMLAWNNWQRIRGGPEVPWMSGQ